MSRTCNGCKPGCRRASRNRRRWPNSTSSQKRPWQTYKGWTAACSLSATPTRMALSSPPLTRTAISAVFGSRFMPVFYGVASRQNITGRKIMRQGLLLSLLVCGVFAWVGDTCGAPWARFRGPNGTGIATDKDIPVEFNEKEGILWKVPIPGLGKSSPVVWGERLFLQTASKSDRERTLLCLDVKDGKVLWSQSVSGTKSPFNPANSLATSTPATDGKQVYTVFWDGKNLIMV